ncbi:MAG: hypothetical protein ACOZQL_20340 [Myxococcota bacterium]
MRRPVLLALLGFGVVAGYGSAFAHAARWHHGGCHDRWAERARFERWGHADWRDDRAAPPAPSAPQTVVVPQAAPPAAPAPQVFVIMPGAQPAPQVVTVPAAVPAPAPAAPPAATP